MCLPGHLSFLHRVFKDMRDWMEGVGLVSFFCEYEEDEFWAGDSGFGGFLMDDLGRGITGGGAAERKNV